MTGQTGKQWNQDEIERHLKSAMDTLTPNVLDRIDLTTPQEIYTGPSKVTKLYRRLRTAGMAVAACLCAVVLGSTVAGYQNHRVESVIGIDVNPSIELSVNRKEKVLKAEPLNEDAEVILDDMDLKDVDLDIAVNALIGSMVRNGYLTDLDNAILVTVANDNKEKASVLRQDVVIDIEESLEAHQVQAVVYDQQASEDDSVRKLASEYGISYGKAYFLQELIAENDLSEEEMKSFAGMTMEEIAREIAERSYTVRQETGDRTENVGKPSAEESSAAQALAEETAAFGEPNSEADRETETAASGKTEPEVSKPAENGQDGSATRPDNPSEVKETEGEEEGSNTGTAKKARIDYVDFEDGHLEVVFKEKVKWKNPSVSVQDETGQSYSAMIEDTDSESCEIIVHGLPGGLECSFILGGVAAREGGTFGSIKGYFETPEIAEEAEPNLLPEDGEDSEMEEKLPETIEETERPAPEAESETEALEENDGSDGSEMTK